jgi:hypothetical protein
MPIVGGAYSGSGTQRVLEQGPLENMGERTLFELRAF